MRRCYDEPAASSRRAATVVIVRPGTSEVARRAPGSMMLVLGLQGKEDLGTRAGVRQVQSGELLKAPQPIVDGVAVQEEGLGCRRNRKVMSEPRADRREQRFTTLRRETEDRACGRVDESPSSDWRARQKDGEQVGFGLGQPRPAKRSSRGTSTCASGLPQPVTGSHPGRAE